MTDPLDALRHTTGATAPDPEFRARLMAELGDALAGRPAVDSSSKAEHRHSSRRSVPDPDTPTVMEISMDTSSRTRWTRRAFPVAAALALVAVIVAALVVSQDRDNEPAVAAPTTTIGIQPAATTTSVPSTTLALPQSDVAIAEAGLLTYEDIDFIGGGWTEGFVGEVGPMDSATAATVPSCAPFVDVVFENDGRPATIRKRWFGRLDGLIEQDVVVFPTLDGAVAMMDAVADPAFPACWADFGEVALNSLECCEGATSEPVEPHAIRRFGDQMVNLAFAGQALINGVPTPGEGAMVFVRVGRAVMFVNPPAILDTGEPGYSDEQVEQFLAISVAKLRAAQEV